MKAWVFQREKGKANAYFVGWRDQDGKRREKKFERRKLAEQFQARKSLELEATEATGVRHVDWSLFRKEYEAHIKSTLKPSTVYNYQLALNSFERVCKPVKVSTITSKLIDQFVTVRCGERGTKPGSTISSASVNSELRVIRRALRIAKKWKYLPEGIEVEAVKEAKRFKRFVSQEHFELIYAACNVATYPDDMPYSAADWWRALLVFTFMTGWRISEPLALLRQDVDLKRGEAITRADDNKAGRDERVSLHPLVIDHLESIPALTPEMFPWGKSSRAMYPEFHRIQKAAGIRLPCSENHEHTEACHLYGFHDLRRGFATVTGLRLDNRKLQHMMRHKSYQTTQRYVDLRYEAGAITELLQAPSLDRSRIVADIKAK